MKLDVAVYTFLRVIVYGLARVYWRLTIEGQEHLPARGSYVVAPVHRSNVDTPLAALITSRRLRFMAKDSLWKVGAFGWLVGALGGFPVRRGRTFADREALRQCLDIVAAGEPLVMFPEGTRKEGPLVEEIYHGPAFVASRTGVPIVPVGIGGSSGAMPRGSKLIRPVKIHIVVGAPIEAPLPESGDRVSRQAYRKVTDELRGELQRLYDLAEARARRSWR